MASVVTVTTRRRPDVQAEPSRRAAIQVIAPDSPVITAVAQPGPQGADGERGQDGAEALNYVAAVPLGGHRVIRAAADGLRIASVNKPDDAGLVLGITTGAVEAGEAVPFLAQGTLIEPSWSWALGPVYLGQDGRLTQMPPRAAFEQQVGTAMAPDRILVRIDPHIILASEA